MDDRSLPVSASWPLRIWTARQLLRLWLSTVPFRTYSTLCNADDQSNDSRQPSVRQGYSILATDTTARWCSTTFCISLSPTADTATASSSPDSSGAIFAATDSPSSFPHSSGVRCTATNSLPCATRTSSLLQSFNCFRVLRSEPQRPEPWTAVHGAQRRAGRVHSAVAERHWHSRAVGSWPRSTASPRDHEIISRAVAVSSSRDSHEAGHDLCGRSVTVSTRARLVAANTGVLEATVWGPPPRVLEATRSTCRAASIHRRLRRRIQALDRQDSAQLQICRHLSSRSSFHPADQFARTVGRGPGPQHSTGSWLSTLSRCNLSARHRLPSTQKQAEGYERSTIAAILRHVTDQIGPRSSSAAASGQPAPAVSSSTGLRSCTVHQCDSAATFTAASTCGIHTM